MRAGRSEDAEPCIGNIARTFGSARCAMTERAPSSYRDIGDWFVHCPENGDVIGGFEF